VQPATKAAAMGATSNALSRFMVIAVSDLEFEK
jgi:hypothetical protein